MMRRTPLRRLVTIRRAVRMRNALAWATMLMLAAAGVAAQEARPAPLVLQLPMSTRALGLGGAYPLASTDADAIFHNPGLLDTARGISLSLARYGGASTLFTVAGAAEWWRGGVGLSLQALSYSATSPSAGAFARGEAGLSGDGPYTAAEHVASVAYARALFGFRVGAAAKLIEQRFPDERDVTAAADLGVARSLGPVVLGLSAHNLGRDPDIESSDVELPRRVSLAASTRLVPVGELDVAAAASVSALQSERYEAGAGIELSYWPISGRTFYARAGFRWVEDSDVLPLTLGAGFAGDRIALDYGFQDFENAAPVHRIGIRWR